MLVNFDVLEELLEKSLVGNLMLQPKETPLILTEGSIHCKDLRLKLTEFLFEKYNVPALFLCKDSVLSSFACGRSTALVLDCGNNRTVASPVHDGYALQKCIIKHDIGGATISNMLQEWLSKEMGKEVRPRFTFSKVHKNLDGQESFELKHIAAPNIDPTYYKWC